MQTTMQVQKTMSCIISGLMGLQCIFSGHINSSFPRGVFLSFVQKLKNTRGRRPVGWQCARFNKVQFVSLVDGPKMTTISLFYPKKPHVTGASGVNIELTFHCPGPDYIRVFSFYRHIKYDPANMLKIKRDIDHPRSPPFCQI